MTISALRNNTPLSLAIRPKRTSRRKLERLWHIHPMTPERQAALVQEARAACLAEQATHDLGAATEGTGKGAGR